MGESVAALVRAFNELTPASPWLQAMATSLASLFAVEHAVLPACGLFAVKGCVQPFMNERLASAVHGGQADAIGLGDLGARPGGAALGLIGLQQAFFRTDPARLPSSIIRFSPVRSSADSRTMWGTRLMGAV